MASIEVGSRWRFGSLSIVWVVQSVDPSRGRDMALLQIENGSMTQRVGVALLSEPKSGWRPA